MRFIWYCLLIALMTCASVNSFNRGLSCLHDGQKCHRNFDCCTGFCVLHKTNRQCKSPKSDCLENEDECFKDSDCCSYFCRRTVGSPNRCDYKDHNCREVGMQCVVDEECCSETCQLSPEGFSGICN